MKPGLGFRSLILLGWESMVTELLALLPLPE